MNSCYHPTKLTLPKFRSNIFTEPPKYVKLHVIAENSQKGLKWLNSDRVAGCQRAQKPRIKNPKTSNRAQYQCQPATQFLLSSVELKRNFLHKERELVLSPYKAHTAKFHSNIFTEPPKYVKLHEITENSRDRPEMTIQCLHCSMPTGKEALDQKFEIIKSCTRPIYQLQPHFHHHPWN